VVVEQAMNEAPEERRRRAATEALSSSMRLAPSTGIRRLVRYPEAPDVLICTSLSGKVGSEVRKNSITRGG
jgi:hypothetical protein